LFIKWLKANYSEQYVKDIISYLDRYMEEVVNDQMELFKIINSVKKGKRQLCLGIRALLNFYETFNLMSEESLMKYRKVVKIPRTNSDDYIPEDSKVIEAFKKFEDERYRILFKLLAFSGIRLKEAIYLLNSFNKDRLILSDKIAKYPLSLDRKTKDLSMLICQKSLLLNLRK